MAILKKKEFDGYLKKLTMDSVVSIYLIYGAPFFYKEILEKLVSNISNLYKNSIDYKKIDGSDFDISSLIESIDTFSLFSTAKIVSLNNSKIFYSKKNESDLFLKVKKAYGKNEIKKAAMELLSLFSIGGISLDVFESKKKPAFSFAVNDEDKSLIDEIVAFIKQNNFVVPEKKDEQSILKRVIKRGFAKDHYLIITTDYVDKRKVLFKIIKEKGVLIDCLVPEGNLYAQKKAQESAVLESIRPVLVKNRKKLDNSAFKTMYDFSGFDLYTFFNNLEKLINYVGKRESITVDDIKNVLKKTRKDEIFQFTGSVSERDLQSALKFLNSLMENGFYSLQILSAMINIIRKLLAAKSFIKETRCNMSVNFGLFKKNIFPGILKFDEKLLNRSKEMGEALLCKTKKDAKTDLIIAGKSKSPYPVYLLLKNSQNYSMDELVKAVLILNQTDHKLKSSAVDHKIVLETALIHIM